MAEETPAIDDDDQVIVPAPDASVFFKPDYANKPKPKTAGFGQSIGFRQTTIPILFTGGFILIALAALHYLWNADNNPMGGLPVWLTGVMFLFGLVLWGLAVANMMTVKHLIAEAEMG